MKQSLQDKGPISQLFHLALRWRVRGMKQSQQEKGPISHLFLLRWSQ